MARAVALHKAHLADPLEVLRRLGGRELAAMAGAILAARTQRVPVLLDGYVATAAAACSSDAARHLDHCSRPRLAEPAHRNLLKRLGKDGLDFEHDWARPGAALAAALLKAAVNLHNDMATFASAGVSGKENRAAKTCEKRCKVGQKASFV